MEAELQYLGFEQEKNVLKSVKKAKLLQIVNGYEEESVQTLDEDDSEDIEANVILPSKEKMVEETESMTATPGQYMPKTKVVTKSPNEDDFKTLVNMHQYVTFSHEGKQKTYSCHNDDEMHTLNGLSSIFGLAAFKFSNDKNSDNLGVKRKLKMDSPEDTAFARSKRLKTGTPQETAVTIKKELNDSNFGRFKKLKTGSRIIRNTIEAGSATNSARLDESTAGKTAKANQSEKKKWNHTVAMFSHKSSTSNDSSECFDLVATTQPFISRR